MPILCNELWPDRAKGISAPLGNIDLQTCETCSLIWNRSFDDALISYSPGYENALHFSMEFRSFASGLARDLIERHGLQGGHVVEIGAGDGYFLETLVEHGVATGSGYDPSLSPEKVRSNGPIRLLNAAFGPGQLSEPIDAVICRHVVEHLTRPKEFLVKVRQAMSGASVPIYIEVPNTDWILRSGSLWDVIYEHVTYWTTTSLGNLFTNCGIQKTAAACRYGNQFLSMEGRASTVSRPLNADKIQNALISAARFSNEIDRVISTWNDRLADGHGAVVIWGAGSKGITFANIMGKMSDRIIAMIDQNPRKWDKFIPGLGIPVLAPAKLPEIDPSLVIVSNGLYLNEVTAQLEALECNAETLVLSQ